MTRIWPDGEPAAVERNPHGDPMRFTWRGHRHRIARIEQRWQTDTDWWNDAGRVWRDDYAVLTDDGLLAVLFHDLITDGWFVTRLYD